LFHNETVDGIKDVKDRNSKTRKVQLESARIVTGLPKFASRDSLYYETGWEPLSCRHKSRKLTTFYLLANFGSPVTILADSNCTFRVLLFLVQNTHPIPRKHILMLAL
jgi:hypothetical protein